jgi:hypothetical protein
MNTMMSGKVQKVRGMALILLASSTGVALLVSGCGAPTKVTGTPVPAAQGEVRGGQQPVAGVNLQLYTANTSITGPTGYGSTSSTFGSSFTTTPYGHFNFPSLPSCPSSNAEVFLVGTGGTPIGGSANANLALMAGLGPCSTFVSAITSPSYYLEMNELTTVATVWSLSGFMKGPTNIGAPTTNTTGLANAFAAINEVVNIGTGQVSGPTLPAGATLPVSEINALGNVLQNCINSAGGVASDTSTPCGMLFSLTTTSSAPTDTITAAMNIAQHPSVNATLINQQQSATPAFSPALNINATPTDWTIAINYTGGGLTNPQSLAVDASGNVWVTNPTGGATGTVTELTINNATTTAPLYTLGTYTAGGTLNAPYGIAIDQNQTAWVTNSGNNTLTQITAGGASSSTFSGNGLSTPEGIAIDGADNVWVVNSASGANSISGFTNAGVALTNSPYTGGGLSSPTSIAVNPK